MIGKPAIGTAPGKVILFGEHAVVYGQPAIAVPVRQVRAVATIQPSLSKGGLTVVAEDLGRVFSFSEGWAEDPLTAIIQKTLVHLGSEPPDARLHIRSTIPIASGLGSGAAVSTAIVRALARFLGHDLPLATVSRLVYEVEKLHHGTPSGIDNTAVVFEKPVFFVKGQSVEAFGVGEAMHLVIGDTGIASHTRDAVSDVRAGWKSNVGRYERLFSEMGGIAIEARALMELTGTAERLGELMNGNHELLCELDVSCPELERLVSAARAAGGLGAKLSGAGCGGNVISLVAPGHGAHVAGALRRAGAMRVIETVVSTTR